MARGKKKIKDAVLAPATEDGLVVATEPTSQVVDGIAPEDRPGAERLAESEAVILDIPAALAQAALETPQETLVLDTLLGQADGSDVGAPPAPEQEALIKALAPTPEALDETSLAFSPSIAAEQTEKNAVVESLKAEESEMAIKVADLDARLGTARAALKDIRSRLARTEKGTHVGAPGAGNRAPIVSARCVFKVQVVEEGKKIEIVVNDNPATTERFELPIDNVTKLAYGYTDKHIGPRDQVGNKGGSLMNRIRAALGK